MRCARTSGFSLIELLAVIVVVSVLLAIALPALSAVRLRGYELKSLANLSQIGHVSEMYSAEHGTFIFGTSGPTRAQGFGNEGWVSFPVWRLETNWPLLVHGVAPWSDHVAVWISPRGDDSQMMELIHSNAIQSIVPVSYRYSNSFIASPRVWDPEQQGLVSDNEVRAIRPSAVRFPSSKVIFYDSDRSYIRGDPDSTDIRPVLFVDGSARMAMDIDATDGTQNLLDLKRSPRIYHDTPHGVYGQDF